MPSRLLIVALMVFGIVIAVTILGSHSGHGYDNDASHSRRQLSRIAEALDAYIAKNGHMPPPFTVDPDTGERLHSWRSLILPQLGYSELYDKIDFSKPWDHPSNIALSSQRPKEYAAFNANQDGATVFQAVVGEEMLWRVSSPNCLNPGENWIYCISVLRTDTEVQWMEPKDIEVEKVDKAQSVRKAINPERIELQLIQGASRSEVMSFDANISDAKLSKFLGIFNPFAEPKPNPADILIQ